MNNNKITDEQQEQQQHQQQQQQKEQSAYTQYFSVYLQMRMQIMLICNWGGRWHWKASIEYTIMLVRHVPPTTSK